MNKKNRHFAVLLAAVLVGFFLLIPLQQVFLSSPDLVASLGITTKQNDWIQKVVPQITPGFWLCSLMAVLIWIGMATSARPVNSRSALRQRVVWWCYVAILMISMTLVFYSSIAMLNASVATELQLLLLFIIPMNVIIGFWLPTALATPGSLRFIPPLAMDFREKLGI